MADLPVISNLPRRTTVIYKDLQNVNDTSICRICTDWIYNWIYKALFNEVTPKFAQVRGNFINKNDKQKSEWSIFLSDLNDHFIRLKTLVSTQHQLIDKLKPLTGKFLYSLIVNHINTIQYNEQISSFKTKKSQRSNFKVPIINLSSKKLSVKERKQLEMGLEFSFVDKNKHLEKQLAANFKTLSHRASDCVHHQNLEDFHECLRAYTDIFTKNVYATNDFTYRNLKDIIKNHKLVVYSGHKDSSVVIMQQEDVKIWFENPKHHRWWDQTRYSLSNCCNHLSWFKKIPGSSSPKFQRQVQ